MRLWPQILAAIVFFICITLISVPKPSRAQDELNNFILDTFELANGTFFVHCADGTQEVQDTLDDNRACMPYPRIIPLTHQQIELRSSDNSRTLCRFSEPIRTKIYPIPTKHTMFYIQFAPNTKIPGCNATSGLVNKNAVHVVDVDGSILKLLEPTYPDHLSYMGLPKYVSYSNYDSYTHYNSNPSNYSSFPQHRTHSKPTYYRYTYHGSYPHDNDGPDYGPMPDYFSY